MLELPLAVRGTVLGLLPRSRTRRATLWEIWATRATSDNVFCLNNAGALPPLLVLLLLLAALEGALSTTVASGIGTTSLAAHQRCV